jgi:hypothetical protein
MYSDRSYPLTKEEYYYLFPAIGKKLLHTNGRYYFIDLSDGLGDMLDRLKGLYDNYDEFNRIIVYKCFKASSIEPFREIMRPKA